MTLINITILSIVQGLTEFLPVSSSGHLVILPHILNFPDQGLDMDLAAHIGTLLAVILYYFKDLWNIAKSFLFFKNKELVQERKLGFCVIIATIPAVISGLIMHHFLPDGIRAVWVVATTSIVYGAIMIVIEKISNKNKDISQINYKSAIIIGLSQVLALIPGTSRSGITILAARFLGYDHTSAAKFSFLMSIPSVAGAGLIAVLDLLKTPNPALGTDMLIAVGISFVSGLCAIAIMMRWLKILGLVPFGIYRILLGAVLFLFFI